MKAVIRVVACVVLAGAGAGCGGNHLAGTWSAAVVTQSGATVSETLVFNSDGTGTITFTGTGGCSGTQTVTGVAWDTSGNTLQVAGSTRCTSTLTCAGTDGAAASAVECSTVAPYVVTGACTYDLSNSNNTLTLSNCASAPLAVATFTRTS